MAKKRAKTRTEAESKAMPGFSDEALQRRVDTATRGKEIWGDCLPLSIDPDTEPQFRHDAPRRISNKGAKITRRMKNSMHGHEMSPQMSLLKLRYQRMGLDRWNNKQVKGLCRALGVTVREIAALAGEFNSDSVKTYLKNDSWPMPLALHFSLVRTSWMKSRGFDVEPTVMTDVMAQFLEDARRKTDA